jgi:hypothetical protein
MKEAILDTRKCIHHKEEEPKAIIIVERFKSPQARSPDTSHVSTLNDLATELNAIL